MKKFFALLFLALLTIAVKSDDDYYERQRIQQTIVCLQTQNKWLEMVAKINKARQQYYRDDDYIEYQLVNWCDQFCSRQGCDDLVDEYLD